MNEIEETLTLTDCLDNRGDDECRGAVEYRMPLSGSGRSFIRCDKHWSDRLDTQDRLRRDYGVGSSPGVSPPSWFDSSYAGESWDEDY